MENNTHKMNDHDLLITMHEQIKNIRLDIKEIKDGTAQKIEDHEARLREIEKFKENWTGRNAIIAVVAMFFIGLLGSYVTRFLQEPKSLEDVYKQQIDLSAEAQKLQIEQK